jgi:hypothetical protein
VKDDNLDLDSVKEVMRVLGGDCVLIGGWASYLHLRNVALSHDVDTILDPLHDKDRVSELISAHPTHLGKLSGALGEAHVDLYVPHTSVIGGVPVERYLPYRTEIDGVNVLIPEAHILTKIACVLDDSRFNSRRAAKDTSEIRGLMPLANPRVAVAIAASSVDDPHSMMSRLRTALERTQAHATKKDMKKSFGSDIRAWNNAINDVEGTLSESYPVTFNKRIMFIPDEHGKVVRFSFKEDRPHTVETLRGAKWSFSRSVAAGEGKRLLSVASRTHPYARAVSPEVAKDYASVTKSCLLCAMPLSDAISVLRGYGPDCASRIR